MKLRRHALILAGGIGARLWPKSRLHRPKQFLELEPGRTLLAATAERAGVLFPHDNVWVVCKPHQVDEVARLVPGLDPSRIIVEPVPKGTGAAVILGAMTICRHCPDAVVTVFPSDHSIRPVEKFSQIVSAGMDWAEANDSVVIYGIKPDAPDTSYGYIEAGGTLGQCRDWNCMDVTRFHEKPDPTTAAAYCRSNRFLWNSGMLSFSVRTLERVLKERAFAVWEPLMHLCRQGGALSEPGLHRVYSALPEDSFDTAVLEKLAVCRDAGGSRPHVNLVVFPCDFEWYDLGVWESFYRMLPKDASANVLSGRVAALDCRGCLVLSEGKTLIGAIGMKDVAVVCVEDAVLVCPRDQLDRVRELVENLGAGELKDYV